MLCHYAVCCNLFTIMLNVIILSVIVFSVIMLSVIMLSVVAPFGTDNIRHYLATKSVKNP
jgi:hypothetical protein